MDVRLNLTLGGRLSWHWRRKLQPFERLVLGLLDCLRRSRHLQQLRLINIVDFEFIAQASFITGCCINGAIAAQLPLALGLYLVMALIEHQRRVHHLLSVCLLRIILLRLRRLD